MSAAGAARGSAWLALGLVLGAAACTIVFYRPTVLFGTDVVSFAGFSLMTLLLISVGGRVASPHSAIAERFGCLRAPVAAVPVHASRA